MPEGNDTDSNLIDLEQAILQAGGRCAVNIKIAEAGSVISLQEIRAMKAAAAPDAGK